MEHILVYDIISSGMKTTLFASDGTIAAEGYQELSVRFGEDTAEQSPQSWLDAMKTTTAEVLKKVKDANIKGISFTAMSTVCLCVDKDGKPLEDAFTWSDSRGGRLEDKLGKKYSEYEYVGLTGFNNVPSTSIRKFEWVKEFQPDIYAKTYKMIQCKDYLVFVLTGKIHTDGSDGGTTGAMDVKAYTWSKDVIDTLGIDMDKMPELKYSDDIIGYVTKEAAAEYGLPEGVPVLMGAGDLLCSAIGAGVIEDGDLYMSLGSTSWIAKTVNVPVNVKEAYIKTLPHAIRGKYLSYLPLQTAGVVFKWLKTEVFRYDPNGLREVLPFKNIYPYEEMEKQVNMSPLGAKGLLFLPHVLEGESSHAEPYAGGAFIGCRWEHTREDMIRAALEGVCYEIRKAVEALGSMPPVITITGIASHELGWLQMLADVLGTKIRNTNLTGTPDSIGCAVQAGVTVGVFDNYDVLNKFRSFESEFVPNEENHRLYDQYYKIYLGAFAGIEDTLKALKEVK